MKKPIHYSWAAAVSALTFFATALLAQPPAQQETPVPPHERSETQRGQANQRPGQAGQLQPEQVIQNWLGEAQKAAQMMLDSYGTPDEVTRERLIWHNNGPWKRTEVVNEEIDHNFPMPHKDMLYQTINYDVPVEKANELLELTGSLIIDRVKGELTARCDDEKPNFLSLNLAHRIVEGEIDAQEARQIYAEAMREDQHPELKESLVFQPPAQPQGDPDQEKTVFAGPGNRPEQ